jgi:NADPH-dependent glutamate synthase beta subunit-like oxidoreductase
MKLLKIHVNTCETASAKDIRPEKAKRIEGNTEYQTQALTPTHTLNLDEPLRHILDFEKLKYCFECGICTASCPVAELLPKHYNPRTLLHSLQFCDIKTLKSAELWLCAWCYRCYKRCPQSLCLPEIFQALRKIAVEKGYLEGFYKALKIIRENVPLPASSCYVSFHPERAIENKQLVTDAIQKDIIDYEAKKTKEETCVKVNLEKVAIIGAGPAGLSAAQELLKKGYSVTVFEASSSSGGMLKNCIPEYRLPTKIIDFEIKHLKDSGMNIKKQLVIGESLKVEELFQEYDALFVATGASKEKILGIKGEELKGVFYALDFLEKANMKKIEVPDKVTIIGGGDVAVDCARTALRRGAKEAKIIYRRSKEEMPANPWEIKEAEDEGVEINFLVSPKRIIGENDKVVAIECLKNELGEADETGRKRPVQIRDSEFKIRADSVIVAIGQFPNIAFLPETVEITDERTIAVNPFTFETTSPGIFAGGDVVIGPGSLMEALAAGKEAAFSIDRYLRAASVKPLKTHQNEQGRKNGSIKN